MYFVRNSEEIRFSIKNSEKQQTQAIKYVEIMKNLEFLNDNTVPRKSASNIASPNQIKRTNGDSDDFMSIASSFSTKRNK